MPKSVRRLYESLGKRKRQERQQLQGQQKPGCKLNPDIYHGASKTDKKDLPVATKELVHPCIKVESSSSSVDNTHTPGTNVQSSNASPKQNDTPKAQRKQSNYKKLIAGASSKGAESDPRAASIEKAASRRRRSVRSSGPRDYWILGSKRKMPIYNETLLSKPLE